MNESMGGADEHRDKVLCSICNERIQGSDWVLCARCEVPLHRACWTYNGACPIYGCGAKESREPVDLLLKARVPIVIDGPPPPPVPASPEALKAMEERAGVYLKLLARKGELAGQLDQLKRRRHAAHWYIPGGGWVPPFILMMFLAPGAWTVWLGFLGFGITLGTLKKIKLVSEAPQPEELRTLEEQMDVLDRFTRQLKPPA